MIDPGTLAAHSLWIAGLALILATASHCDWQAARQRRRFGALAAEGAARWRFLAGGGLAALGLLATSATLPERVAWMSATLVLVWRAVAWLRLERTARPTPRPEVAHER